MKKDKEKKKKRIKRELPSTILTAEAANPESAQPQSPVVIEPELPVSPADDPLQFAFTLVGGRWKLRILWVLRDKTSLRYGEIKQQTGGITDMMLSQSLRELTADGLCVRQQFQQIPPKVEYQITPAGAELLPAIGLLRTWAVNRLKEE